MKVPLAGLKRMKIENGYPSGRANSILLSDYKELEKMVKFKILMFSGAILGLILFIIATCARLAMESRSTESGIVTLFCGIIVLIFLAVTVINHSNYLLNDRGR